MSILTRIQAQGESRTLTISLIGIIGQSFYEAEDESVTELVRKINEFEAKDGDEIHVLINSRGGNYFAAVHLYNTLKESKAKITTKNMGVAASGASAVLAAGDVRIAYPGSITMAHMPLVEPGMCNAEDLREFAKDLDDVGLSMKSLYLAATGLEESALDDLLQAEKSMTPEEALENGFVTEISADNDYQAFGENIDSKAQQRAEIEARFRKDNSNNKDDEEKASAEAVIVACSKNGLSELVTSFHAKNFTKRELNDSILSVKAVKDVCAAIDVSFDEVKDDVFDQAKLLKTVVTAVQAQNQEEHDSGNQTEVTEDFKINPINGCD